MHIEAYFGFSALSVVSMRQYFSIGANKEESIELPIWREIK